MGDLKDDVLFLFDEKNDTVNKKIISGNIDAIAILKKGQDAIESYRLARFLMHTQVYYHHVRAITDNMLNRAVEIAIRDNTLRKDYLKFHNDNFLNNYLSLDDSRLFIKILSNNESNSSKLINDLENRILLKRGYEIDLRKLNPMKKRRIMQLIPKDFRKLEGELAEKCGCDKDFIIMHLQKIENTLYKSSYEFFKSGETPILILDNDGPREIEKESPIFGSQDPLLKLYIFCPEESKNQVNELAEDVLS